MKLARVASRAAALAPFLFPLNIHAFQNVTLRFSTQSQQDSCDFGSSDGALTFTTGSVPIIAHCFNFAELFGGDATQGFVNQTQNLAPGVWEDEAGIHWELRNKDKFDTQANYTSVLYHQHVLGPTGEDRGQAVRRVTLYGGKDCSEKDPNSDKELLPWYGFSCYTGPEGSCGDLPYGVVSFTIQPGLDEDEEGTCWTFAERGAAARSYASYGAITGGLTSASLALWLAW